MSSNDQSEASDEHSGRTQEEPKSVWPWFFEILPNYLVAVFTFLLAIFAYEAWDEATKATRAVDDQLIQMRATVDAQISQLDLTTRSIITTDPGSWKMVGASKSPVISFRIENAGASNALILDATYETVVARDAPRAMIHPQTVPDFPALVGPKGIFPVVIGLPALSADEVKAVGDGSSAIWLRVRFIYRDDRKTVYQVFFTGRYGNGLKPEGTVGFRFTFPDAVVPQRLWDAQTFEGIRCLNVIKSEPADLGCGEKK